MALYLYVRKKASLLRKVLTSISLICVFTGLGLVSWTLYPILSFELYYAPKLKGLIKPIPTELINNTIVELPQVLGTDTTDYTKASVWFPKAINLKLTTTATSYTLSIPKVGIENAQVIVGAEDLTKSLTHFTGPLPGNYGNPVIFGHSTLLWFYNPKDYKAIFSKLPELTTNDDIIVTVDSVTYQYKVIEMQIVSPENLSVLTQTYDYPYITLVTCVPPGTYLKRLVVKGKLVNI